MYDARPPPPHRSRIILGDGSIKNIQFIEKIDLVFHNRINYPVTLHDGSFVPDLEFNLSSLHVAYLLAARRPSGAHLLVRKS